MRVPAAICECCILALVLVDAFTTLVLARRTQHSFRGTIALTRQGVGYQIRVNWLTGGVDIVPLSAL